MTQQMTIQIDRLSENQQTAEKIIEDFIDAEYGFCALIEGSFHCNSTEKKFTFRVKRPLWELGIDGAKKIPFPLWLLVGKYRLPCVVSLVEISPVERFEKLKWSACPGLEVVFEEGGVSIGEGDGGIGFFLETTKETKLLMQNAEENDLDHTYIVTANQIRNQNQLLESLALRRGRSEM